LGFENETQRRHYTSGLAQASVSSLSLVWQVVLETLRPVLGAGKVDLIPEPPWGDGFDSPPEVARRGWATLMAHTGSTGLGVWVDLADDELFSAFQDFALYSIHSVAYGDVPDRRATRQFGGSGVSIVFRRDPVWPLIYNHDQGWDLAFELTDAESSRIRARLADLDIPGDVLSGPVAAERVG
jgi:hypothetical protein